MTRFARPTSAFDRLGMNNSVHQLDVNHAEGVWLVRSTSQTLYFLDLDRRLLLRQPGPYSPRGPFDGVWVHLVRVSSALGVGAVVVGQRHMYDLDPDPGGPGEYRWWLQRTATSIESVAPEDKPAGRRR